ncbi:MAG: ThuA domain-containing protein [Dyadobacter sp.]|uniref:ThuA domain-containing protein n=1 Tax=Dyadobacter sp. TaxID=1914288 RepID=UPI003265858B
MNILLLLLFAVAQHAIILPVQQPAPAKKPIHIVFVTGDEEYRSEESMPMLGQILKRELGAKITVCYALDSNGNINPNRADHIDGLEALKTADLMVVFARYRELPKVQAKLITDYVESGRPVVGFRTASHTFMYKSDSSLMHLNTEWPAKVFGQQWITHHGHFEDGNAPLTSVYPIPGRSSPILNGVYPFNAFSWLYHVDGGEWKLQGDAKTLLEGKSLRSKHQLDGKLDKYPLTQPVAWTKTYTGSSAKTARVFFTTLGHPFDFKEKAMRKLALNGMYWALGLEGRIPKDGVNADFDSIYEPNNSGFGDKFKANRKPQ